MNQDDPQNPVTKAIEHFDGGICALAKVLKVSHQAIRKWEKSGNPPPKRVLAIEAAVKGKVTRYELRPDIYPSDDSQEEAA